MSTNSGPVSARGPGRDAAPAIGLAGVETARPDPNTREGEPAMNPIALDTALVRVAVALDDQEGSSLKQALERQFGRPLALRVDIDPRILGGVWVQVGDVIVDGSLRGRLEALRHHLRLRARTLMALDDAEGRANPAGAENP